MHLTFVMASIAPHRSYEPHRPWTFAASATSVLSALLASACCIGPLLLAALGIGGGVALTKLEPYRPYFTAVTLLTLGTGFYFAYRPRRSATATSSKETCDCPAPRSRRIGRVMLWIASALVAALLLFPHIAPALLGEWVYGDPS